MKPSSTLICSLCGSKQEIYKGIIICEDTQRHINAEEEMAFKNLKKKLKKRANIFSQSKDRSDYGTSDSDT